MHDPSKEKAIIELVVNAAIALSIYVIIGMISFHFGLLWIA